MELDKVLQSKNTMSDLSDTRPIQLSTASTPQPLYRPSVRQTPAQKAAAEATRKSVASASGVAFNEHYDTATHVSTHNALRKFDSRVPGYASVYRRKSASGPSLLSQDMKNYRRELLDKVERANKEKNHTLWQSFYYNILNCFRQPLASREEEVIDLARAFFPPRMELPVVVCDIGADKAERFDTTLGKIERCWKEKPDWAVVRWIHAPLGLGIVHSSIEDMFLHDWHEGRHFTNAGPAGFPYLEIDCLQLYDKGILQDMRDAYALIREFDGIQQALDDRVLSGNENETFANDVKWRSLHLAETTGYWKLVGSDLPAQLSDALGDDGPIEPLRGFSRFLDTTLISRHPQFREAQLCRVPLRAFHRQDGCVLTLSVAKGIDYLNRDFPHHLTEDLGCLVTDPDASVIGKMLDRFKGSGVSTWEKPTVEHFLVYLFTEIAVTPHNICDGRNFISVLTALQTAVQDLKQRRFDRWEAEKTIQLVRVFLAGVDELKALSTALSRKLDFFKKLTMDVKVQDEEDLKQEKEVKTNPDGESAMERIDWATRLVERQLKDTQSLCADLEQAMNTLFQLRSMEQNELAITADSQNKAILIFTGVTIVFLPLSFFTSYYGMNLSDIRETTKGEDYFWKVCGSVTVVIIFVVSLASFGHRMRSRVFVRNSRRAPLGSMV